MVDTDRKPIKIQAPWAMKRMETTNEGKVTVSNETPTVDLLPDAPAPEQPPLVEECVITERFCDGGPGHPFSLYVNYRCPICDQTYRIALDNIWPGNKVVECECHEKITLPLVFDIDTKGPWLKFWNPKAAKH